MNHEPIHFLPVNKFWEANRASERAGFNSGFVSGLVVGTLLAAGLLFLFAIYILA